MQLGKCQGPQLDLCHCDAVQYKLKKPNLSPGCSWLHTDLSFQQELTLPEQTQPLYQALVNYVCSGVSSVYSPQLETDDRQRLSTEADLCFSTDLPTTVHCNVAVKPSHCLSTHQLYEAIKCYVPVKPLFLMQGVALYLQFSERPRLLLPCSALSSSY